MFLTIAQTLLYHFYTIDYKAGHSDFFEDIFCPLHLFPCSSAHENKKYGSNVFFYTEHIFITIVHYYIIPITYTFGYYTFTVLLCFTFFFTASPFALLYHFFLYLLYICIRLTSTIQLYIILPWSRTLYLTMLTDVYPLLHLLK
jgi:hypothetical protein